MYFRSILLIFLCICVTLGANAQLLNISGTIYKKSYNEKVAQVIVTNTTRKIFATSNNMGVFHIQGAKGDTLLFQKPEHTSQYSVISGPYDINIYMQPIITLGEVTVREQSKKQELNDVLKQYRKQGSFTNGEKPKALSFLGSPLTAMNELFGTTAKRARHFKEYSKNELEQLEVSKRYNKAVIKKLTPLPDDEIEDFMNYYSPSYQAIKEWNDYDLINYVRTSYDYYKDNKSRLKLKKLY